MQSDLAEKMANLIEATHWVFCRGMQAGMAMGHKVHSFIMVRRLDNKLLLQYNMSGFPFITVFEGTTYFKNQFEQDLNV